MLRVDVLGNGNGGIVPPWLLRPIVDEPVMPLPGPLVVDAPLVGGDVPVIMGVKLLEV